MRRRHFLSALAAAPFAASLSAHANPSGTGNRLLVLVYTHGGNDGYNTWVPFTNSTYYGARPTIAVPRDAVLKLTDQHGFHPAMSSLVPVWEQRQLAILQGIGLPDVTQQHFRDTEMAFTASDAGEYTHDGWATRALARLAPTAGVADAVAFDMLDIREADPMGPFRGNKRPVVQVAHASEWLDKRSLGECTVDVNDPAKPLLAQRDRIAAPLTLRTEFPTDQFGMNARAAVELAATHPGVRVIHIALNGHDGDKHHSVDTHWDQLRWQADALGRLTRGLAALRAGLIEIGRWDETLVVTYDEFGRSLRENERGGTHHGLASTHFAMGGRVKGGLYGEPTKVINLGQIGGPPPSIDTREVWISVTSRWWGADASGLFRRKHQPLDFLKA